MTMKKYKNNRCLAGVLRPANTKRTDQDPARRRHEKPHETISQSASVFIHRWLGFSSMSTARQNP